MAGSTDTREWAAGANRAGVAIGTPQVVTKDVSAARAVADVVVVMVHGGTEYRARPAGSQRAFAAAAVDAGAALVLGHHPHVLQGYARREGTLVAFSLGNFLFARFDGAANDTAILDVTLTPDGVASLNWIPLVIEGGIPRPAVGPEIPRVIRQAARALTPLPDRRHHPRAQRGRRLNWFDEQGQRWEDAAQLVELEVRVGTRAEVFLDCRAERR